MKNKEYKNSLGLGSFKNLGFDKKVIDLVQQEFDKKARLAGDYRSYCRNMNNRLEKMAYIELAKKNLGAAGTFLITASPAYLTEKKAVWLMGKFKNGGDYVVAAERSSKYHLHFIGKGKALAKYIVNGLRFLDEFKPQQAVHITFAGTTEEKVNYLLKDKQISYTHFDFYFKDWN
jgi:hypothetical protein